MANKTYNRFAVVADATPAVALATPAFAILPWSDGTSVQLKSQIASANVMMPNGASAGDTNTDYWIEGSTSGQLCRDASIDLAFQSILMNAYATKVLIPGSTSKPVCYEKTFVENGVSYFRQGRGCEHSKVEIKWDAESAVDYSTEFLGINDSRVTTMITGATYAAPNFPVLLWGKDVTVTVGALGTLQLKKGSITIDMPRKAQTICGSTAVVGLATNGMRKVTISLSFYKRDFAFDTAILANAKQTVATTLGGVNTGYKFDMAAVTFGAPQDEDTDDGILTTITGTAAYDNTALADLKITQL